MARVFRSKGLREKEKKFQNRIAKEGKKKYDDSNRLRNKTVAFRLTEEEKILLDKLVGSSGLLKQDYIIQALTSHSVTYFGSPKMARGLDDNIKILLKELKRIKNMGQVKEEQLIYLEKIMELSIAIKKEEKSL